MIISIGIVLRIKNVSDKICREIKSDVSFSNFFRKPLYGLLDNVEKIWYDQTGYMWQYKAAQEKCNQIDTHSQNLILTAS
jgi:hypothetical protein